MKTNFLNLPKPLKESDYQELSDLVVEKLKNIPAVKSIYLLGGSWMPGISDLDITIVRKTIKKGEQGIPSPWALSHKSKYIFIHNFWELDEESFRNLKYFTHDTPPKLLWGKDISIRNPQSELSDKEYQFLEIMIIFDFLINKLLFFPRYLKQTQLNIRQVLGEVYSLIYTLEVLDLTGLQTIETDFPEKIKKLRETWFDNNQEENIKELMILLEQSIDLILEVVVRLDNFVKEHNLPTSNLIFKNRKYYLTFDKDWTKDKFISNFFKGHIAIKRPFSNRVLENFKIVLPQSLSYFFMVYANQEGLVSDWIRKSLTGLQKMDIPVNQGIYQHIKVINDSAKASIKYRFDRIPFPYGLLIHSQTLLSRLGDILILSLRKIKK